MIKPEFNLFMYSQPVYGFAGGPDHSSRASITSSPSIDTASNVPEVANKKENLVKSLKDYSKDISNTTKKVKEKLIFKDNKATKEINGVSAKLREQLLSYKNKINSCTIKDDLKKIERSMREAFLQLKEKIKDIEKADANKKKLIDALEKQVGEVSSMYKEHYKDKLINNENIKEKHLDMLLDAYLMRIYLKNAEAIKKMDSENINLLALTLQDGKYVNGPIVDDVREAREYIDKAIALWQEEKPRSVYKNKEWDTEYEDTAYGAPARVKFRKLFKPTKQRQIQLAWKTHQSKTPYVDIISSVANTVSDELKAEYAKTIEGMLPPLPDWGEGQEKVKHSYVSSLEGEKGKLYVKALKDKMRFLHAAQGLREKLLAAGVSVLTVKLMPDKKSARLSVEKDDKRLGYITVLQNGRVNFSNADDKRTFDITGKLNDIPKLVEDMEKRVNEPKISDVSVDAKRLLVKGENLPSESSSIQIDPSKTWLNLHSKIQSGVKDVGLPEGMENLDSNLLKLLKKSIKDNLATIGGLDVEAVMKHIGSEELDTLKKETIDNQKPKIIVWGSASMEGGFETNRRIAKARAESVKRKLENKGYKVEARWEIQGLRERIDSAASYKENEEKMLEEWNEKVNPEDKAKDIKEIYAKLKDIGGCTEEEKEFLNKYFVAGRRVAMQVEYPEESSATRIAMKFEETDSANA